MPKISIIIPSYNACDFVRRCTESIQSQTFQDFEVIVIDDGSKDNSLALWQEVEKEDSRFHVVHQENRGQAVARNNALKYARGEYITYLDVDDTISSTMLEELYEPILKGQADLTWCELEKIENGIQTPILPNIIEKDPKKDYILNNAGPTAKLIKRETILKNKLFFLENKIYEDIAMIPSYALYVENIFHVKKALYGYHFYEGSTMHQPKYNKKLEDIFDAMKQIQTTFKGTYQEEIEYLFIHHLLHAASLRFFAFQEGKDFLLKIASIMKEEYPNWRKNKYLKQKGIKFRMICNLFYQKQYWLLKLLLK